MAKGTVFLYFPTKEHIVQAIEIDFNARIVERTRTAAKNAADEGTPAIDLEELLLALCIDEPANTAAFLVGGITLLTDRAVLREGAPDGAELARAARRLAASTITTV